MVKQYYKLKNEMLSKTEDILLFTVL